MAELPRVKLFAGTFLFSHSNASDVNIAIIVNFGYFVKTPNKQISLICDLMNVIK